MQHNKTKTHTEPKNVKTAYEWVEWVTATGKPNGVDDAHWAELTPKQKAVIAHRLMCISEYRKGMV